MDDLQYHIDYNDLKDMTYLERIDEFLEFSKDRDIALLLEYFYTSFWHNFSSIHYNSYGYLYDVFVKEIENYYNYLVYSQSGNFTTSKIYAYTNENLDAFFSHPEIDVEGKSVLTVGSSGDQALHSILNGARRVDIVDMNIMTKLFVDLKTAMIRNLNFEEFSKYSSSYVEDLDNYYKKISHDLPKETQLFFDTIVLDGCSDWLRNFIRNNSDRSLVNSSFYVNSDDYYRLQEKLINNDFELNVINAELRKFVDATSSKYDFIFLSNIYDYFAMRAASDMYGQGPNEFTSAVKSLYDERLKSGGIMEVTSRDHRYFDEYGEYMNYLTDFLQDLGGEILTINNAGMNVNNENYPALLVKKHSENEKESIVK